MRAFLSQALLLLMAAAIPAQIKVHPDEIRLKPKIDAAITSGVEALLDGQRRDGTWGRYGNFNGGKTALCVYALLKSGVSINHQAVRRAFGYLRGVKPRQTYSVACMMLAYAAAGGKEHLARIRQLSKLLVEWQRQGDFGYPFPLNGGEGFSRPDLSNTQYAALGLWIAQKHKVKIPRETWMELIEAALQYRSKPEAVVPKRAKGEKGRTVAGGKIEIVGFGYTRGKKPTGSMTSAGVAILQMCKIGLGGKLRRKDRRRVDEAIDKGVAWLAHHFSVRNNPGARGSWSYYYLYGLERVGSLLRIEKMGDHWWYVRGARHLVSRQRGSDGMWHGRGGQPEVKTAFALLFLQRATSGASVTGQSSGGTKRHLFSVGDEYDDVAIGGAGQQPVSLWIKSFGEDVKARYKAHGLRVVQVEYLEGDRVLGQVAGDPTKAWTNDSFLHRAQNLRRGMHKIQARITVVAHDVPPGQTTPTAVIKSPEMDVEIRDVWAKWMEAAAELSAPANLMRSQKPTVTATSHSDTAKRAMDSDDSSHWVSAREDKRPELTIEFEKAVSASKILLTQAGSRTGDRGLFDHILNVEVWINKKVKPLMIEMNEDQMGVTTFQLPRRQKIRKLRFRIVLRLPGQRAFEAGFSEIGLLK